MEKEDFEKRKEGLEEYLNTILNETYFHCD